MQQDDLDLIRQYKEKKNPLFVSSLLDKYSAQIIAFGLEHFKNREDIKDFTNDLFLKLCEKLKKEEVSNFKGWLYVFMKNMFYDAKRREKLHTVYVESSEKSEHYSIETSLFRELDKDVLNNALGALSADERACLQHIYFEGKSYNEIIQETGWAFNKIRGLRDRATKKLRDIVSVELKQSYS